MKHFVPDHQNQQPWPPKPNHQFTDFCFTHAFPAPVRCGEMRMTKQRCTSAQNSSMFGYIRAVIARQLFSSLTPFNKSVALMYLFNLHMGHTHGKTAQNEPPKLSHRIFCRVLLTMGILFCILRCRKHLLCIAKCRS